MTKRLGLGPVFGMEWLRTSRHWWFYVARSLFIGILLLALYLVWAAELQGQPLSPTLSQQARIGEKFFYALVGTQLTLVLLVAPATTASAVCHEKGSGALVHLLVTDLSNSEIIQGKLAARLMPVVGLVACSAPILFITSLFGGIDLEALIGAFLITFGVAILGCTLALTISVWAGKTYEVLLAVYLIFTLLLLLGLAWSGVNWVLELGGPPIWLDDINPYWMAFAPYSSPGAVKLLDQALFLGGCCAVSVLLIALMTARVRAVTIRQLGKTPRKRRAVITGARRRWRLWRPSLDRNPVLWRESQRRGRSRWVLGVWIVYIVLAIFFSGLTITGIWTATAGRPSELPLFVTSLLVSVGLLLMSVGSVTALSEERARGSLDILLTTPLRTSSIVWGKWWGSFRRFPALAILPCLIAGAAALHEGARGELVLMLLGLVLAYAAALNSLGLALATWISRQSRAIGLCVTAYILATVGWIFLLVALFPRGGDEVFGLAMLSPFYGVAMLTDQIIHQFRTLDIERWTFTWIIVYSAVAIGLYVATLHTFDRYLGRASGRRRLNLRPSAPRSPETQITQSPIISEDRLAGDTQALV